ncbi:hypothetical protein DPMN_059863 [Dreissena polymorpha]|uniref:Uncharacterized protein n=1 Tax=Dreissena polymorpha TaxID=45954 RepID=A0A9D4C4I9_DREPO|nr:hypothetical protein DPMN_059863 [Dreissena polymorpha]
MYSDEISTDYEADIELQLENGKVYRYKGNGRYKGINARMERIKVKDAGVYDVQ